MVGASAGCSQRSLVLGARCKNIRKAEVVVGFSAQLF